MAIWVGVQVSGCGIEKSSDVGYMSFSKLLSVLLILAVFAAPVFVPGVFGADAAEEATSAVYRAEVAVISAFEAVVDAEEAGANVSGLLTELNVAGGYLAEARVWLGLGDFDNATRFADLCYYSVEDVRSTAVELKNEAHALWVTDSFVRMILSLVGVIVVVFFGFIAWRAFRRRYHRRLMGLRPGVFSSES